MENNILTWIQGKIAEADRLAEKAHADGLIGTESHYRGQALAFCEMRQHLREVVIGRAERMQYPPAVVAEGTRKMLADVLNATTGSALSQSR